MFVILGAAGKVGRTTARLLREAGAPVRAVVRDPAGAAALADLGCAIAVADLRDATAVARALDGAAAVQVICPVEAKAADPLVAMGRTTDAIAEALEAARVPRVLAISDYGAEQAGGTGVTLAFHALEARLRAIPASTTFLRSAEHMENHARVIGIAARTGVLPSLHQPLDKQFPTVSAFDVGAAAAELLLESSPPGIVHIEGPRRYTPTEVAAILSTLLGRPVGAQATPRAEWAAALAAGGVPAGYIPLVTALYDTHNAGRIDAERDAGPVRHGRTSLADALRPLVAMGTSAGSGATAVRQPGPP